MNIFSGPSLVVRAMVLLRPRSRRRWTSWGIVREEPSFPVALVHPDHVLAVGAGGPVVLRSLPGLVRFLDLLQALRLASFSTSISFLLRDLLRLQRILRPCVRARKHVLAAPPVDVSSLLQRSGQIQRKAVGVLVLDPPVGSVLTTSLLTNSAVPPHRAMSCRDVLLPTQLPQLHHLLSDLRQNRSRHFFHESWSPPCEVLQVSEVYLFHPALDTSPVTLLSGRSM